MKTHHFSPPLLAALALGLALAIGCIQPLSAQGAWQDKTRILPEALRQIPDGLLVWDSPNPSYPERDTTTKGGYIWRHDTHMQATLPGLEVVACGSYIWYSAAGWQANITLSPTEFAEKFRAQAGPLKADTIYIYKNNSRYAESASQLYGGDALWYVIAKDKAGRRYKGIALVETEPGPGK